MSIKKFTTFLSMSGCLGMLLSAQVSASICEEKYGSWNQPGCEKNPFCEWITYYHGGIEECMGGPTCAGLDYMACADKYMDGCIWHGMMMGQCQLREFKK
jgi:hypothetical protein